MPENTKNVCQYWSVDENGNPTEPSRCSHWDGTVGVCTYTPDDPNNPLASHYPYCNMLGTQAKCNQYDGDIDSPIAICTLPDPGRHVADRRVNKGKKWVDPAKFDATGDITLAADFEAITGYNNGNCDGHGTDIECVGYSSYHLGFSKAQPDDSAGTREIDTSETATEDGFTTVSGMGYRLPLNYEVYNHRAQLSRCYWWDDNPTDFTISSSGTINPITSRCFNPDEITFQYRTHQIDNKYLGMRIAPCNGCKAECPRYTGICWEYCVDEKMSWGDKVLAEQILELRYYMRKDKWIPEEYKESFRHPEIDGGFKAWHNSIAIEGGVTGFDYPLYAIESQHIYLTEFEGDNPFAIFDISYHKKLLQAGTPVKSGDREYPTLVRELQSLSLRPIIRNTFDYYDRENDMYLFETTKIQHKYILIVGDMFEYGGEFYAVNLNNKELRNLFPPEILEFDCMEEIEATMTVDGDTTRFDEFYEELNCLMNNLIDYWPDEDLIATEFGSNNNMFYMNVPTYFGRNEIVVIGKTRGRWDYDKIKINKVLSNGIIVQSSFTVGNANTPALVSYLPSYENDFMSYANGDGELRFKFLPFTYVDEHYKAPEVSYIYNDGVRKRLDVNPVYPALFDTYEMGYELYKITAFTNKIIAMEDMRILGNAGYILVIVPDDNRLTNAIKDWEIEGDITLTTPDGNQIEMEVYEKGTDRLAINQFIIKPKSINDLYQICNGSFILIDKIYIYEKHSFGEEPTLANAEESYEKVDESFIGEDDVVDYVGDVLQLETVTEEAGAAYYKLTNFGSSALVISVVFKGYTGRVVGQMKAKMLLWIRQPYCRDVEIKYSWSAIYGGVKLLPELSCYGKPDFESIGNTSYGYAPPCGDHDASFFRGFRGVPMWYPYNECDSSDRYNITGALTEWDISIMEVFGGDSTHGSNDIRMMGPATRIARTCDTHAQLWACTCDWSFCNYTMTSANLFGGYGRYRGGMSEEDKVTCTRDGGAMPQFGNVVRDFLRSYRTVDNVDYYYFDGSQFQRRRKWVPLPEFYSKADMTDSISDMPYKYYCSNDYYDDDAGFTDPAGLLLAGFMENIEINETIDVDGSGNPNRYEFNEIFRAHNTSAGIVYPTPKDPCYRLVGSVLTPLIHWYTYKDFPGVVPDGEDADDYSIQWAWQEIWRNIERLDTPDIRNMVCYDAGNIECCPETNLSMGDVMVNPPYEKSGDEVVGRHAFFDYYHPPYKYGCDMKEHKLVCDEGDHIVYLYPPTFEVKYENADGAYYIMNYFAVALDSSSNSKRSFDINGNWDVENQSKLTEAAEDYWTYQLDTFSWFIDMSSPDATNDVTIFTDCSPVFNTAGGRTSGINEEATKSAFRTLERVVDSYDNLGELVEEFYGRGLQISLTAGDLNSLPKSTQLLENTEYEIKFGNSPEIIEDSSYTIENEYTGADTGEWFPAVYCFSTNYSCGAIDSGRTIEILFKIMKNADSPEDDSGIGAISKMECSFVYGAEETGGEYDRRTIKFSGNLFHMPAVEVLIGNDEAGYTKLYECMNMPLADKDERIRTKKCMYDFDLTASEIYNQKMQEAELRKSILERQAKDEGIDDIDLNTYLKVRFRIAPTAEEVADISGLNDYYKFCNGVVAIKCIYIYHTNFVEAKENIKTWERKYNISYGKHGDFPPAGYDSTGSLFYTVENDGSTVYQYDTINGVVGMPGSSGDVKTMNKCRGRILKDCHADKEALNISAGGAEWLLKAEAEQKKIHDAVVDSGDNDFWMTTTTPPGIQQYIDYYDENGFGLVFPTGVSCYFQNATVLKLAPVIPKENYNSYGHYFYHDYSRATRELCGRLFSRFYADIFTYVFKGTAVEWDHMDAFVAFYRGTGNMLTRPSVPQSELSKGDELNEQIRALNTANALSDAQDRQVPPVVDPF